MKAVTAEEMRRIDAAAIGETGIPGGVLMAFAGKAVAGFVLEKLKGLRRVAVLCGSGNNGGDGFVAAYFLSNYGVDVDVFIVGEKRNVSETSRPYLTICERSHIPVTWIVDEAAHHIEYNRYDLIIDALLGTGFSGTPRGVVAAVINAVNAADAAVLAVDMPSGLPSDGEAPAGAAVRAKYTVTIGLPKISLVVYPGKDYAGEMHVADIGFPRALTESDELRTDVVDAAYVGTRLRTSRGYDTYKGIAGHLLLVGGFDSMEGAILMSAMAAFETGVGLATLITTAGARNVIAGKIPELMCRALACTGDDAHCTEEAVNEELDDFFKGGRRYDAIVIGPGMGRTAVSSIVFNSLIERLPQAGIPRALIDGDGLYLLADYIAAKKLPEGVEWIITPHWGEASRLAQLHVDELKKNRLRSAKQLAQWSGAVALLKGPATIVTDGTWSLINTTGNPALATAGSGDVLSGIIGALLLRGIDALEAAGIGAYLHGRAADMYVEDSQSGVMKATDIVRYIRKAMCM